MDSFYTNEELKQVGFLKVGENVKVSRFARIYGADKMTIGSNVRIDDFCILSGKIEIGNNVHISAYVSLFAGTAGIYIRDFVAISSRTAVYAVNDDYTGTALVNPTIPDEYRNVQCGKVEFCKHTLVGTGCTVLPGVVVGEGASVGAMSLISKNVEEWSIAVGIPCKKIKDRSKNLLKLETEYLNSLKS